MIVVVAGIAQFLFPRRATAPQPSDYQPSTVENNSATTSESSTVNTQTNNSNQSISNSISIEKSDTIVSWDFKGAYTGNTELIAKAKAEIERLSDLVGKGTYTDIILYISIANQYDLLGDGKNEYNYLSRAITADKAQTSGLPWHNLGVLMERLGASKTASIAYERAVFIQPIFSEIQQP